MQLTLVFLPFLAFLASWPFNGQQIPFLALSMLLLLLWGGLLLWWRNGKGLPLPRGGVPLFMLAYAIWLGSTLLWTSTPYTSWFYFWIIGSLPLAYLLWQLMPDPDEAWARLWPMLVLSAAALAGWGLYQYAVQPGSRPTGPLLDWNSYAAFLNLLFFPILVRFFLHRRAAEGGAAGRIDWIGAGYMALLAAMLFAFFAASSRGGTLAWLLIVPLALWTVRRQAAFRRKAGYVLGAALATFLVTNAISAAFAPGSQLSARMADDYIEQDRSVGSRFDMWRSTWHIIEDHPLLGTGLGSYFIYYPAYRDAKELESAGTYAHNDYLQFLQEGGPLNLLFLAALPLLLLFLIYRQWSRPDDPRRVEAAGLYLSVLGISAHAVVNFIFFNLPLSLLAGLLLGRAYQLHAGSPATRPLLPRLQIRPAMARTALLLALSWPAAILALDGLIPLLFTAHSAAAASLAHVLGMPEEQLRYRLAGAMAVLRPAAALPHVYLAEQDTKLLDLDLGPKNAIKPALMTSALQDYQAALTGNPRQPGNLLEQAKLLLQHQDLLPPGQAAQRAERLLRTALAYNPQHVDVRLSLAQLYFNQGKNLQGYALLKEGVSRPLFARDRAQLRFNVAEVACQLGRRAEAQEMATALLKQLPGNPEAAALARRVARPGECEGRVGR
ncbi:MAG: O-antigen ligase family protein [Pseudomonadota bacterium]